MANWYHPIKAARTLSGRKGILLLDATHVLCLSQWHKGVKYNQLSYLQAIRNICTKIHYFVSFGGIM